MINALLTVSWQVLLVSVLRLGRSEGWHAWSLLFLHVRRCLNYSWPKSVWFFVHVDILGKFFKTRDSLWLLFKFSWFSLLDGFREIKCLVGKGIFSLELLFLGCVVCVDVGRKLPKSVKLRWFALLALDVGCCRPKVSLLKYRYLAVRSVLALCVYVVILRRALFWGSSLWRSQHWV